MKAMITMMKKKPIEFEVISHEQAVKQHQENDSKLFKLKSVQLPDASLKDAERAINLIPVTNKLWTRLQAQLKKEKEKERQKQLQEQLAQQLLRQQQHEQDINDDGFEL